MIELRVTGDTAAEIVRQVNLLFGLPDQGVHAPPARPDAAPAPTTDPSPPFSEPERRVEPPAEPQLEAAPKRRGRLPKAVEPQQIEATAAEVSVDYTADSIKERVKAIIDHLRKAHEMPAVKDKVMALFGEFGVLKASDVPAERYAEFMARSEAWLAE